MWIAFIFQYLWDTKQLNTSRTSKRNGCELLSFFSIFGIQNNEGTIETIFPEVVNCFHFSVSLGYKTTFLNFVIRSSRLWIAFIFQYLWDTKQHPIIYCDIPYSCELLSFFSIFGIQNNIFLHQHQSQRVVNCFHFSVSLGYKTTAVNSWTLFGELWIAFIFQYLWDTKQRFSR